MARAAAAHEHRDGSDERTTGSFLVRVWYEAREGGAGDPAFRGYVKNLQTGEERFARDPETVKEHILGQVEQRRTAAENGRPMAAKERRR